MPRPTISVIVPTLNEADNLPHVLPRIPSFVDEVLLVDGHSTDRSIEVARELVPDIKIVMQEGRGKGAALRSGFAAATGDIIVMLDADGSTDPAEIPYFVHALLAGADFAKGSRFLHGAGTSDMPFHRRMGNAAFVQMVRRLYGGQYTDLCYGYNAFWRRVLPLLDLDGDGFEIETMMNIRALRANLRIVEVPSFEDRRVVGEGRLRTIPDGWRVLRTIWSERRRAASLTEVVSENRGSSQMHTPIYRVTSELAAQASDSNGHSAPSNGHGPVSRSNGHDSSHNTHIPLDVLSANVTPGAVGEDRRGSGYAAFTVHGPAPEAAPSGTWQGLASQYVARLGHLLDNIDTDALAEFVEELRGARERGSTIFFAGNGGSSATAAHWVNDLGKATKVSGRAPIRVMNLSDNVPWLTALGNDEGIERVFVGQLENFARPDDLVVVISASGNSPNILRLLEFARERGMRTLGLVGFDGGAARALLDRVVWVETEKGAYGLVETAHTAIADIVTTCLIEDRVRALEPTR